MKTEWDSYYQQSIASSDGVFGATRSPTTKGEAYDNALLKLGFAKDWTMTPWQIGQEIDAKAAHWLMTVLLRRDVMVQGEFEFATKCAKLSLDMAEI